MTNVAPSPVSPAKAAPPGRGHPHIVPGRARAGTGKDERMITRRWLRDREACREQVAIFAAEWPKGVEITPESLRRAAELELDLYWLARRIVPAPLRAEYLRQEAALTAEYILQAAPLRAKYHQQGTAFWPEYLRQEAALWAEYLHQLAEVLIALLFPGASA